MGRLCAIYAYWICVFVFGFLAHYHCVGATSETDAAFWLKKGSEALQAALDLRENKRVAKNLILHIGDGMGVSTITAARIYKGQKLGRSGEEQKLSFEEFPYVGLLKTYSVDRQVTDSAATGTALMCGVKNNLSVLGFTAAVEAGNCSRINDPNVKIDSVLQWALQQGKSVGLVTTTRVTHATPAAAYAHSAHRNWESDADMSGVPTQCGRDIAYQLIINNSNIQVILGGGWSKFFQGNTTGSAGNIVLQGSRTDGMNLIQEWQKKHQGSRAHFVSNANDFRTIRSRKTDYLLGLFSRSHMDYELHRNPEEQPSLAEMTEKAIKILRKNRKGFFLLVEGGRIDHGHHDNRAKLALEDALALDKAVTASKDCSPSNTLTVTTADHSHVFTIAGYPRRGNSILGLVNTDLPYNLPTDNMPYTTLGYANGPGSGRKNLTAVDTTADDFRQSSLVPFPPEGETHGGDDVAVYSQGPMAHLLEGAQEQSYVAHVMAYAACIGPYDTDACRRRDGLA